MLDYPRSVRMVGSLLLVLTLACGEGGDSSQFALVGGAVMVMDDDLELPEGAVVASTRALFGVTSATRDEARILVLTAKGRAALTVWHPTPGYSGCPGSVGSAGGGTTGYHLFVSDDEGGTWRDLPLIPSPGAREIVGLAAWGGRVVLVEYRFEPSDGVTDRGYWRLREVDPMTGAKVSNPTLDGQEFQTYSNRFLAVGSRITFFTFEQFLNQDAGRYQAVRYDLADDTLQATTGGDIPYAGGARSQPITQRHSAWLTLDGDSFEGLAWQADLRHVAGEVFSTSKNVGMCWRRGTFADPPTSTATECIDFRGLPVELHHVIGPARTASGLVALATFDGYGFALPLSYPFTPGRFIALGEGEPHDDADTNPRWGGLVRVTDRFVDIVPDGPPVEVPLRLTPCVDPSACGDTPELQVTVRLEDGDMLNVYVLDRHEGPGEEYALVVLRERPIPQAFTAPPVSERPPGGNAFFPDAQPVTPLDRACLMAERCIGAEFGSCMIMWGQIPAQNASRAELLAATTCDSVRAAWPDAALIGARLRGGIVCG